MAAAVRDRLRRSSSLTALRPYGLVLAVAAGIICLGFGAKAYWDDWRLTQEFGPIIFKGDGGLCSVKPHGNEPAFCPRVHLSDPKFSPDGRSIAAARSLGTKDDPNTDIVVADRRGAIVKQLSASQGFFRPVWSPDGRLVYALSYRSNEVARWRWPSGEKETIAIQGADSIFDRAQAISFSPSGRRAAVLNGKFDRIFVADVAEKDLSVRSAMQLPFTYVTFPVWKDEDRFLTIARTKRGEPAGLWEINANTSEARKIEARGLAFRDFLALSPDGSAVAATATQIDGPLAWSIWRVDLGTGNTERLTQGREDVSPSWGD